MPSLVKTRSVKIRTVITYASEVYDMLALYKSDYYI